MNCWLARTNQAAQNARNKRAHTTNHITTPNSSPHRHPHPHHPQHQPNQIILGQPAERQAHLAACLDKLMQDVGRGLDARNRDKFTQNLTVVRHEYRSKA